MKARPVDEINLPDRKFEIAFFYPGHSQLLLRASRRGETGTISHATRVSILFKGVSAMSLPTVMHGLSLTIADDAMTTSIVSRMGISLSAGDKAFSVSGSDYAGYVVALIAFVEEDEEDSNEPGQLGSEVEIGLAWILPAERNAEKVAVEHEGMALLLSSVCASRLAEDLDVAIRMSSGDPNASAKGMLASWPPAYHLDVWLPIMSGRGPVHVARPQSRVLVLSGADVVLLRSVLNQLFVHHIPPREGPSWVPLTSDEMSSANRIRDRLLEPPR